MLAADSSPGLPYQDVATPAGSTGVTSVIVRPDCRRVIVAPARRASAARLAMMGSIAGLGAIALLYGAAAWPNGDRLGFVLAIGEPALILVVLAVLCIDRGWRRLAFEVTPHALTKVVAGPFGTNRAAWPRSAVRDVRLNRFNRKLVLHLDGQDPLEVFLGTDPEIQQFVADELVAALAAVPPAAADAQARSPEADAGLPPSRRRSALVAAALALAVAGVVTLSVLPPLSIYVFALAAVPAGLAFGTQRKDFWT